MTASCSPLRRVPAGRLPAGRAAGLRGAAAPPGRRCALVLAVAAFLVFCLGMTVGDYPIGLDRRRRAPWSGPATPATVLIVQELRLPRAAGRAARRGRVRHVRRAVPDHDPQPAGQPRHDRHHAGAGAAVVAGIVLGWDGGLGTQALGLLGGAGRRARWSTCWPGGAAPPATGSSWSASGSSWMCTSATDYLLGRARASRRRRRSAGWSATSTAVAGTRRAARDRPGGAGARRRCCSAG